MDNAEYTEGNKSARRHIKLKLFNDSSNEINTNTNIGINENIYFRTVARSTDSRTIKNDNYSDNHQGHNKRFYPAWTTDRVFFRTSSLNSAIEHGDIDILKFFFAQNWATETVNGKDRFGRTALHSVFMMPNLDVFCFIFNLYKKAVDEGSFALLCGRRKRQERNTQNFILNYSNSNEPVLLSTINDEDMNKIIIDDVNNECQTNTKHAEEVNEDRIKKELYIILNESFEGTSTIQLLLMPLSNKQLHDRAIDLLILLLLPYMTLEKINDKYAHIYSYLQSYEIDMEHLKLINFDALDTDGLSIYDLICNRNYYKAIDVLIDASKVDAYKILNGSIISRTPSKFACDAVFLQLSNAEYITLLSNCIKNNAWKNFEQIYNRELLSNDLQKLSDLSIVEGNFNIFKSLIYHKSNNIVNNEFLNILENESISNTVILTHPGCLDHLPYEAVDFATLGKYIQNNPENAHRLESLLDDNYGVLKNLENCKNIKIFNSQTIPAMADILRIHDSGYIQEIKKIVLRATEKEDNLERLDQDTTISIKSWDAALNACGTVIEGIKAVVDQYIERNNCKTYVRNVFCAVRPPGHHLGVYGGSQPTSENRNLANISSSIGSQGFCILNNVAIGAAWAKYNLKDKGINKIAIIDFDIHHGNGTENIIHNLSINQRIIPSVTDLPYRNIIETLISIPSSKIWRDFDDSKNVFFASIHGYNGVFYPGTGKESYYDRFSDDNSINIINVPIDECVEEEEYIERMKTEIVKELYRFKPDLILLSAGFDGHRSDDVGKHFGHLSVFAFKQLTKLLVSAANDLCNGRLVSVLEGGYNCILGGASPFANCVAAHVDTLAYTSRNYSCNKQ